MADKFTSNELNAKHLTSYNELYEPARSNNFQFVVSNVSDFYKPGRIIQDEPGSKLDTNSGDIISISIDEAFVPHFELGVLEIQRGNSVAKFAGVPTFSNGTIKLNDYIGARTKEIIMAWKEAAYDVINEQVHEASNYKRDCDLFEYTPDYARVIRHWKIEGCWVSSISEGSFSNSSNDKRTFEATIVYDRAYLVYDEE